MMKAAAYIRVSTQDQAKNGVSLAAQRERIAAYCLMQDLELTEVFADNGISAGKPLATREGGKALLEALRDGRVQHVVALKLDRLFRDTIDCLGTVREWDRDGVSLHLIDMGGQTLNTGSAVGRFFLTMAAGFAEMEAGLTGERTSAALQHKKSNRRVYGPTPFGFDREGDRLVTNAEEQRAIRLMRERRAAGWSLQRIGEELEARGTPTKQGGRRWYPATVKAVLENDLHADRHREEVA